MNEQWERPDRDAVIRDNPLLEYCQARGWRLKHDGAANRYKCLCPLPQHREKTPSFTIFADQDRFHCFGCGVDGGVIELHAELKGVSGMEAMCDLAGIEYHGGKRAGSASRKKRTTLLRPNLAIRSHTTPSRTRKRPRSVEGWPAFETPTRRRSRQSQRFEDCRPRASRSPLSEVCSFALTTARDAPGSSPTRRRLERAGATAGRQRHGSTSASEKGMDLAGKYWRIAHRSSRSPRLSKHRSRRRRTGPSRRIPSRLVCDLHAGNPGARKGHRRDRKTRRRRDAGHIPHPAGRIAPLQGQARPHLRGCR